MVATPRLQHSPEPGPGLLTDAGARGAGLLVAFTNRCGGVSRRPYDSLNLAARVGDDAAAVAENRARAARAARFDVARLALCRQVHGTDVAEIGAGDSGVVGEADALVVRSPGPVAGILTADCAPVVVWGPAGAAVLHAGWRGLAKGIIERGVESVQARSAWIGPGIRGCCYEVGADVIEAFSSHGLPLAGAGRVDPVAAAEHALRGSGVEKVAVAGVCTACDLSYFSYRRDRLTGRQGAFVALLPP